MFRKSYIIAISIISSILVSSCDKKDSPTSSVELAAPVNLKAFWVSDSSLRLTWQHGSANEVGFEIEESEGMHAYHSMHRTGVDTISWETSVANLDSSHRYRVRAFDSTRVSGWSNEVLTNAPATLVWQRTFGVDRDFFKCIVPTGDGSYLAAGYTLSSGIMYYDGWLVKVDGQGNQVWQRTFDTGDYDYFHCIVPTADGGYLVAGSTGYPDMLDGWLVKVDGQGSEVWRRIFSGENDDWFRSLVPTDDGSYLAVGGSNSFGAGKYDGWIVKVDDQGSSVWQRSFGGANNDLFRSIVPVDGGGFLAAGACTNSSGDGGYNGFLVRLDLQGNQVWNRSYGDDYNDWFSGILPTSDGGFLLAGNTGTYSSGDADAWLVKVDGQGNQIWSSVLGMHYFDYFYSVVQTSDGGFMAAGSGGGNRLVKVDGHGTEVYQRVLDAGDGYSGEFYDIIATGDGGFLAAGYQDSNVGRAAYLVKVKE